MNNLKNLIIIGFIGILALSCTHESEINIADNTTSMELKTPGKRTLAEAVAIARNAAKLLNSGETRSAFERKIDLKDMHVIHNSSTTRSATDIDTMMYVFNFEDSLGFAIVSANEFTPGLIAITESGYYDPSEEQENKAFEALMHSAQEYVKSRSLGFGDSIPPPIIYPDTIIELIYEVSPMVTVKWGQDSFYGQYCPNGIVGCAPLAAAQAMTYLGKPSSIQLTYSGHDIDTQPLDWTNIRKHILYYAPNGYESSLYCTAPSYIHQVIARLCRQIGRLMYSSYHVDPNRTGTQEYGISLGLSSLGLPSTFVNYTSGSTITPLDNGHILYFVGYTESDEGHAWLVDGYQLNDVQIRTESPQQGQFLYLHTDVYYNHINWGWHGCFNGFFLDEVFNTQQSFCLDNNPISEHPHYNFTSGLKYIELY